MRGPSPPPNGTHPGPDAYLRVLQEADVTKHMNKKILRVASDTEALLEIVRLHGSELHILNISTILHRLARCLAMTPTSLSRASSELQQRREWQDLLFHVRRLAPTCNNMELTNCLWSLATLEMRQERETIRILADLCIVHLQSFDARNLALSAWALGKLGVKDPAWCPFWAREVVRKLPEFPAVRDMTMMVWAFATLHWRDPAFLKRFCEEVERRADQYGPQDVGNTLWALATLAFRDEVALAALSQQCFQKAETFDQQALSISLWAFATLQYRNQNLLHYLTQQCTERIHIFRSQGMANIVWACAKFQFQQKCLLMTVAEAAIPKLDEFEPQHLAIMAWAYATLEFPNRPLLTALCQAAARKMHIFGPQHMANMTWAMATLAHKDEEYLRLMARRAVELVEGFNPQECSNLAWAVALLTFRDDELLEAISQRSQQIVADFIPQNLGNSAWAYNRLGYRSEGLIRAIARQAVQALPECSGQEILDLIEAVTTGNYLDAVDPHDWAVINDWICQRFNVCRDYVERNRELPLWLPSMSEFDRALAVQDYRDGLANCNIIGLGFDYTRRLLSHFGVMFPEGAELDEWCEIARAVGKGHELNAGDADKNFEAREGLRSCRTVCVYRFKVRAAEDIGWSATIEQPPTPITSGQPNESFELGLFAATLRHNRAADAEFQAMQSFARVCYEKLGWQIYGSVPADSYGIEGEFWLHLNEVPCFSCLGAMAQFRRLFPNVHMKVHFSLGRQPVVVNDCAAVASCRGSSSSSGSQLKQASIVRTEPKRSAKPEPIVQISGDLGAVGVSPETCKSDSNLLPTKGRVTIGGVPVDEDEPPPIAWWPTEAKPAQPPHRSTRLSATKPRVCEDWRRNPRESNTPLRAAEYASGGDDLWHAWQGSSLESPIHQPSHKNSEEAVSQGKTDRRSVNQTCTSGTIHCEHRFEKGTGSQMTAVDEDSVSTTSRHFDGTVLCGRRPMDPSSFQHRGHASAVDNLCCSGDLLTEEDDSWQEFLGQGLKPKGAGGQSFY